MSSRPISGGPGISEAAWLAVLLEAGAPFEVTSGAVSLWSVCLEQGIDPLVALAFARQEHGLRWDGVAGKTRSWGNVRPGSSWRGAVYARDKGVVYPSKEAAWRAGATDLFRWYSSYRAGLRDWCTVMQGYLAAGLRTVAEAIPVYAPSSENDTARYIEQVEAAMALWERRYGGGVLNLYRGRFTATITNAYSWVNIRSAPGVAFEDLGDLPAGTQVECDGWVDNGAPYADNYQGQVVESRVWLHLADGRGWISGHPALARYQLPAAPEELQARIEGLKEDVRLLRQQVEEANAHAAEVTSQLLAMAERVSKAMQILGGQDAKST